MLNLLVKFSDGTYVRAKSIKVNLDHGFEIITDKNEILLIHKSNINSVTWTTSSWKKLELAGFEQCEVV